MNLLDFIFDNIFIVAIIVIGLFNFLSGMGKKKAQEEKRQQTGAPTTKPLGRMENTSRPLEDRIENMGQRVEAKLEEFAHRFDVDTNAGQKTIEEQRQEQYDRLKRHIQTDVNRQENQREEKRPHKVGLKSRPVVEDLPSIQSHHNSIKVGSLNLEDKLSARGLIDSVIMAEVLGPPRAHNPYQNIAAKRKRK